MRTAILTFCALALVACAGGAATRDTASKPRGPDRDDAPQEITPTVEARPADRDDLAVRVHGRSPVPPIPSGDDYLVQLEIRNRSIEPIILGPTWAQVSVLRDALVVEGCANAAPRRLPLEPTLRGGSSIDAVTPLPCALTEPGVYSVVVVLMTADVENAEAPDRATTSGTMALVIR
ncbi:hypothetical protein [Sandaracinus amylolyticus]|uniref:Uncharacterized protein n=1 Tax=Sandaracinus amylolyticus TaxID=927083 RepID=A0A0F6W7D3_9BACT|nr:hypothetical protein [Sandaracinus amylolyticus]AKF09381.1 hypothetical protein DB32_006530 [Sandaracinus amylolyticus]